MLILRLWRDWCRLWPEQYGHRSLEVKPEGYDPVFDVIPSQAYKDFYLEVVHDHPKLKDLNAFEVIDTALNQVRAPETSIISEASPEPAIEAEEFLAEIDTAADAERRQPRRADLRVVEVDFETRKVTRRSRQEADGA